MLYPQTSLKLILVFETGSCYGTGLELLQFPSSASQGLGTCTGPLLGLLSYLHKPLLILTSHLGPIGHVSSPGAAVTGLLVPVWTLHPTLAQDGVC